MTIECYNVSCKKHDNHQGGEGPFCYEEECQFEPLVSQDLQGVVSEIERITQKNDPLRNR